MLRTWIVYSVSLFATVIFFLFYKMWVAWYLLIALLILPFIALILCLVAGSKLGFEVDAPVNPHIGNPSYIKLKIWGKATYFSFARAFISNSISVAQLERAMYLGELGMQYFIKSEKAFSKLRMISFKFLY